MSVTCTAKGCERTAVAAVATGCVREHIESGFVCSRHLERGERLYANGNLWCGVCGSPPNRTPVRLRVDPLVGGGAR